MIPSVAEIEAICSAPVVAQEAVAGGDVNRALRVELEGGRRLFLKYRRGAPAEMYRAEADGLAWLADAGALVVPAVVGVGDGAQPFLALEWLDLRPLTPARQADFGRALARLHRSGADGFGYSGDNFIGPLVQTNDSCATWAEFYGQRRLQPLARAAVAAGGVDPQLLPAVERLITRLPDRVGPEEPPARLHGDLWPGNAALCDGAPCVFDPAVYGGHREMDLAMMQLFGHFGPDCFDAYAELFPLQPGAAERTGLFQLAPLLVHAVLFGAGYGQRAAEVIRAYR